MNNYLHTGNSYRHKRHSTDAEIQLNFKHLARENVQDLHRIKMDKTRRFNLSLLSHNEELSIKLMRKRLQAVRASLFLYFLCSTSCRSNAGSGTIWLSKVTHMLKVCRIGAFFLYNVNVLSTHCNPKRFVRVNNTRDYIVLMTESSLSLSLLHSC